MARRIGIPSGPWFECWLRSLDVGESPTSSGRLDKSFTQVRGVDSRQQKEVAIELYHALHQTEISLKELSQHITEIGNILSQVDVRQLITQTKSQQRQMLCVFFDFEDISQAVSECIMQDSYAYVYLLVRLLYEILINTKSDAVRTFCFYQIMRNADVLRVLFDLVRRHVGKSGESKPKDMLDTVGQLPRYFYFNAMDSIMLRMLTSTDVNLKVCGIELVRLSPYLTACNPQLIAELQHCILGPAVELANKAAISMGTVLPYVSTKLADVILQAIHSHTLERKFDTQKIVSFCCMAIGCRRSKYAEMAHRMCWNLWLHIDARRDAKEPVDELIVRESQFYLLLTSTIISLGNRTLHNRQKSRMEHLLYEQHYRRSDMEFAFCLYILYQSQCDVKDVVKLLKNDTPDIDLQQELHKLLYNCHVRSFRQTGAYTAFINTLASFKEMIALDLGNMYLIREITSLVTRLVVNISDALLRIIKIVAEPFNELGNDQHLLRSLVIKSLCSINRMSSLLEYQKHALVVKEIETLVGSSDLKYIFKPLVKPGDITLFSESLTRDRVNLLVQLFYDCSYSKPPKVHNYYGSPVALDLLNARVIPVLHKMGNIMTITSKDDFNETLTQEAVMILTKAIDSTESAVGIQQCIQLSLRLGLHKHAIVFLQRLQIYTHDTLLWFNGLQYYCMAEVEANISQALLHRTQSLDSLETFEFQANQIYKGSVNNAAISSEHQIVLPQLVTHTWFLLRMILQVACGNIEHTQDLQGLSHVFRSLYIHYKAIKWCFRKYCSEVVSVAQMYQGLCMLLYAICLSNTEVDNIYDISDDIDTLNKYILQIFDEGDCPMPLTSTVIEMLDPGHKKALFNDNLLLGTISTQQLASGQTGMVNALTPRKITDVSIQGMLNEFVLFNRIKTTRFQRSNEPNAVAHSFRVTYFSRDIKAFTPLQQGLKLYESNKTRENMINLVKLISAVQLPIPAGALKMYPLPFASINAMVDFEKRAGEGPVAIHIQGYIRNSSKEIPWLKIKVDVVEGNVVNTIRKTKLRMLENSIDEYVDANVRLRNLENLKITCLPMESNGLPVGLPTHVRPVIREVVT
ncbi:hypothetical protein BBOV_II005670 [Babesia bovis T2Bo]|uniref:hypothetical protein n=1 Tax=Babesia bovis T2Bo TaxID=484906 RepID=UPI001C368824|nr:hypothetical protein BBOV_II005670 [Babesia bovis T2Bo]EDO06518.2 hypothetical protein BBOV_II005670 [Babesia bovis T2Bo]